MIPSKRPARGAVERPSVGELWKKINDAKELIQQGKWSPADPAKLKENFDELEATFGTETALLEDQTKVLITVLSEITPSDYAGTRPPMPSYEARTLRLELFAFRWKSTSFGNCEMYVKFCLSQKGEHRRAFVHSIHPHRIQEDAD